MRVGSDQSLEGAAPDQPRSAPRMPRSRTPRDNCPVGVLSGHRVTGRRAPALASRHDAGTRAADRPVRPFRDRPARRGAIGRTPHRAVRARRGTLRPARRGGRPRARCRGDVHPVRGARLPDVRRRGDRRPADEDPRRPARADGRVRRRGDGQADPQAGSRRTDCRPGCHQRGQRHRPGPVQRLPAGRGRWPRTGQPLGHRLAAGARPRRRSWPRSPSSRARSTRPTRWPTGCTRPSRWRAPRTAGPVFVDIPMDEFFNSSTSTRPVLGERVRAEPDGDAIADIAELLGQAQRPVLVHGHRRLGRRRRGGRAPARRGGRHPVDHQRHGPRSHPRRTPAARDQGTRGRARRGRPGRGRRHPARLPARLRRSSAARTAPPLRASYTSPTPPARSPSTPTSRPRRPATSPWSSTGCATRSPTSYAAPTGPRG